MNIEFNKYFNLSALSTAEQQQVIAAITDLVLARMADMVGEHLTEEEITQLETIAENNSSDGVIEWLNVHIPNFAAGLDEILAEESADIALKVTTLTNYVLEAK